MGEVEQRSALEGVRAGSALRRIPGWGLVGIAFLGAFSLLIVGILVLVALTPAAPPVSQKSLAVRTMPDGTLLVLEQVTVGTSHRFEHAWTDTAKPFEWLLGSGPMKYIEDQSTFTEQQMLWFTRRDPNTGQPLDFDWWERCVALDDQGWEIEDQNPGRVSRTALGNSGYSGSRPFPTLPPDKYQTIVAHSALPRFRCKAPTYKLRVYDNSHAVVAEFDLSTVWLTGVPEWSPESIPATKTDRDLSVTLTGLTARPREAATGKKSVHREVALEPKLEFRWNDRPTTSWAIQETRLSDALGNTSNPWDCRLNPFESAWKLNIRLYRANAADIDPSEQLVVESIELPPADTARALGESLTVGPVTLELSAIGNGKVVYTEALPGRSGATSSEGTFGEKNERYKIEQVDKNGVRTMTVESKLPHLRYDLTGLDRDHQFQLRVFNEEGKEIFGSTSTFDKAIILLLPELNGAKSIKVVATIQTVREVEFLVTPPEEFRAPFKKGEGEEI